MNFCARQLQCSVVLKSLLVFCTLSFATVHAASLRYDLSYEQRYCTLQEIGSGSYGLVLKGNSAHSVIKVSQFSDDKYDMRNILEAAVLASLDHPGLVKPHDITIYHGTENNYLELTLPELSPIQNCSTTQMFQDLVSLIHYLHSLQISHGDIKAQHIMFGDSVKLIDLGAVDIFATRPDYEVKTTLAFRSPELLRTYQVRDPLSNDIWSLGAAFLCHIHNMPRLFIGDHKDEIMKNIFFFSQPTYKAVHGSYRELPSLKSQFIRNTKLPKQLQKALRDMLANNPEFRHNAHTLWQAVVNDDIEPTPSLPDTPHDVHPDSVKNFGTVAALMKERAGLFSRFIGAQTQTHFEQRVLFEAMSIADTFISACELTPDNFYLAGAASLYLAQGFYGRFVSQITVLHQLNLEHTLSEFQELLERALLETKFKIIYNHSLRESQSQLYGEFDSGNRPYALLILALLEFDSETSHFSAQKKWKIARDYFAISKSKKHLETLTLLRELSDKHKNSWIADVALYPKFIKFLTQNIAVASNAQSLHLK